jgi:predicted nucleic acid-binding protein
MSAEFCDTNILVYAYDLSAGVKRERAKSLVERLWQSGDGVVSIQVLQEVFVTLTRKGSPPLPAGQAREVVSDLATWRVIVPAAPDVLDTIDGMLRWHVSFWDAMLLTTANKAGAAVVWSEDLNHGQRYDGALVQNPLLETGVGQP